MHTHRTPAHNNYTSSPHLHRGTSRKERPVIAHGGRPLRRSAISSLHSLLAVTVEARRVSRVALLASAASAPGSISSPAVAAVAKVGLVHVYCRDEPRDTVHKLGIHQELRPLFARIYATALPDVAAVVEHAVCADEGGRGVDDAPPAISSGFAARRVSERDVGPCERTKGSPY